MNLSLKQVGEKYRLKINETGGYLRQMGPRKLSKDRAEYRLAVLMGEEPYDYTDDPTSPEVDSAVTDAIDAYVATQEKNIATAQGKIDTANATIAEQNEIIVEQQAILDNPESTEEEKAAAEAAIAAAEKKIATNEKTIATQEKNIATYKSNIENAATKVTTVTIEEVPEKLTLDNTGYKVSVKADFSANETTTIEANEKIDKQVQIQNTSDTPANLVLDLGNSETVILAGKWNDVDVVSVGSHSLKVAVGAHVNKLTVERGHVLVDNALVSDNIDEAVEKGGTISANPEIVASKANDFVNKQCTIKVTNDLTIKSAASGIFATGHYIVDNSAKVQFTSTAAPGGLLYRGSRIKVDLQGTGEYRSVSNPLIWLSDANGVLNIHDGKFFQEGNQAECIYAEKGVINIYGGEFHNVLNDQKNYLLNCFDKNYQAGTAKIVVYGGKFYGFDPANNETEGPNTNFVAEGYQSVYHEEENYYEVVPVDVPADAGE